MAGEHPANTCVIPISERAHGHDNLVTLFHHDKPTATDGVDHETVDAVDYDAQAELALPTTGSGSSADDGFAPFAGELAPEPPTAGYDVQRDTGIEPA